MRSRFMLLTCVAGALACSDSTSIPTPVTAIPEHPLLTASSGFTGGLLVQASMGTFHTKDFGDFRIELKAHDNTDISFVSQVAAVGAQSGWHSHLGPVLVAVKSGSFTVYQGDDPTCTPTVYPAGTTFIEGTSTHIVRNETASTAEFVAAFFTPAGQPRRVDQPSPGNCPF